MTKAEGPRPRQARSRMREPRQAAGFPVQTQLLTHRLRWYHRYEFAIMLASVGFREMTVKYGYIASGSKYPGAEWIFVAER